MERGKEKVWERTEKMKNIFLQFQKTFFFTNEK